MMKKKHVGYNMKKINSFAIVNIILLAYTPKSKTQLFLFGNRKKAVLYIDVD
jgi:hypothetical protein